VSFHFKLKFLAVEVSEMDHGLLLLDMAIFPAPEAPQEPKTFDDCTEHLSIIADLKSRLTILKNQSMTAMDQAKKLSALS
jgi:hypothetical protein